MATPTSAPDALVNSTPVQITGPTELSSAHVVGNVLATGTPIRLCGDTIEGSTLDTNTWSTTLVGTGSVTPSNNVVTLATGATANSSAFLASTKIARYIIHLTNTFYSNVKLSDTGVANNVRRWGAYDANNGYFFQLNGTTFGIGVRSGGVDTIVTTFNGQYSPVVDTNFHRYEIQFSQNGAAFLQDGLIIHSTSSTTALPVATGHLKVGAQCTNSGGGTSNVSLTLAGAVIYRYGNSDQRSKYFHSNFFGRVQSAGNANAANTNTLAITLPSGSTAGNFLVCAFYVLANAINSITDNQGQTWTQATALSDGNGGFTYIYYVPNCVANVTTVTLTLGLLVNDRIGGIVAEYIGVNLASPLDRTSTLANANNAAWTSNATAATTNAVELLIGSAYSRNSAADTFTPGTGWSSVATAAGGGNEIYMEDQIVTATGSYAATGTSSGSRPFYASIATFKMTPTQGALITNNPTVLKYGPATLRKININTAGTGNALLTVYDGTSASGAIVAQISLTSPAYPTQVNLDIVLDNGLTIVCNSTTADFTVIYD